MSAKLFAPCGTFVHLSGGEMSAPSQVYFAGMGWPSAKAELVSWIVMAIFSSLAALRLSLLAQAAVRNASASMAQPCSKSMFRLNLFTNITRLRLLISSQSHL